MPPRSRHDTNSDRHNSTDAKVSNDSISKLVVYQHIVRFEICCSNTEPVEFHKGFSYVDGVLHSQGEWQPPACTAASKAELLKLYHRKTTAVAGCARWAAVLHSMA
eukprot:GHUV01025375.1.p2 GENE.GHUV01025375.1~~GHUV01025375.1.p2  ORF type:complete len:106 (-),score=25.64 GHUV01025375.1:250-567(-)